MPNFKDLFSAHAGDYAAYRPRYPKELFDLITRNCSERKVAWDCGTGNGQAALELAERFERVIATDPSESQLKNAPAHPRIEYHPWTAEKTEIESASVNLITVAQALHWFDFPLFNREVQRVAKPGAWLAVWCYSVASITPEVDQVAQHLYTELLKGHWEPERRWVERAYEGIELPFEREEKLTLTMSHQLNLDSWLKYLDTWSAVKNCIKRTGQDPVQFLRPEFEKAWGDPAQSLTVKFPIHLRMGPVAL